MLYDLANRCKQWRSEGPAGPATAGGPAGLKGPARGPPGGSSRRNPLARGPNNLLRGGPENRRYATGCKAFKLWLIPVEIRLIGYSKVSKSISLCNEWPLDKSTNQSISEIDAGDICNCLVDWFIQNIFNIHLLPDLPDIWSDIRYPVGIWYPVDLRSGSALLLGEKFGQWILHKWHLKHRNESCISTIARESNEVLILQAYHGLWLATSS